MVLQLCGRVCRRLSLKTLFLTKRGFLFYFFRKNKIKFCLNRVVKPACVPTLRVPKLRKQLCGRVCRRLCFAYSAKASGILKTLFLTKRGFLFWIHPSLLQLKYTTTCIAPIAASYRIARIAGQLVFRKYNGAAKKSLN